MRFLPGFCVAHRSDFLSFYNRSNDILGMEIVNIFIALVNIPVLPSSRSFHNRKYK